MNLPTTLTVIRIFLIPVLMVFLIATARPYPIVAVTVFLLAVLTDWLDGHLARRRRQVTTLGTLLDPVADKLLIAAALISLVEVDKIPAWIVVLIVGRDIAVTGLRGIAAAQGVVIAASDWGKVKMAAEVVAVTLLILSLRGAPLGDWPVWLGRGVLWGAMAIAVFSGVDYFRRFWRQIDLHG
ncbi:MAG: CDP-diacylglycerol--glycerol-3-phosphate 3-phosphatidyltransferase [candidate division NC10 bacterium]|nr:CDP-diacylglycerol--glycerol-3-phosphate 3-phosphatidyltransferase [candidate division NC10 bacterium]